MSKAEKVRSAASTIKKYCDNRKCLRGEACLFRDKSDSPYSCMLVCQPLYWQPNRVKTRKEVFLEHFPNAPRNCHGEPPACVNNVFGTIESDCFHKTILCEECWEKPAPDEYQEDLD